MFSKLLKYELKSVGKWYFALNASIIAISIFLGFSIKTLTDYAENYTTSNANHYTQLIPIILSIMFGVVVASAWIATLAIIVRRFYKNIFGREGYLTLTLPVSTHQIILSKLIVNFLWVIFSFLVLTLSGIIVFLIASEQSIEILKTFFNEVYLLLEKFGLLRVDLIILYSIVGLVGIIIGLEYLLVILSLLNIGKFKKHKFIKGILIFIVFNFVINIISSIILIIFPYFIGIELREQGLVGKLQIYSLSNILNSEVNISPDEIVLLLADLRDVRGGRLDTSLVKAFRVPPRTAVLLYETTLHYAPCGRFRTIIVLPKGTNGEKPAIKEETSEDRFLWGANKWLIAHPDTAEAKAGAFAGLIGENIDISGMI